MHTLSWHRELKSLRSILKTSRLISSQSVGTWLDQARLWLWVKLSWKCKAANEKHPAVTKQQWWPSQCVTKKSDWPFSSVAKSSSKFFKTLPLACFPGGHVNYIPWIHQTFHIICQVWFVMSQTTSRSWFNFPETKVWWGKIEASSVHAQKMKNCLFNNMVKDVRIFYRMYFLCHVDGHAKCTKQLVKLVSNSEHMSVERVHFNEAFRGCTCSQKMRALIWQWAPLSDT